MKAIVNAIIVLPDHYIPDGVIVCEGDRIVRTGARGGIDVSGMELIDAGGLYAGPGLIEIHTHADGDHFFYEEPEKAAATLLDHGVTSCLAALYFDQTRDALLEQLKLIKKAMKTSPNLIGFYMEAPYLNPKFGCNRENNPWRGAVDPADYMPLIEEAGELAKVWCVAPERENIENFVLDAKKKNPRAVFSVAHSEAAPEQIEALIPLGLRLATHHTNATGTLNKYPECRGVCVDEAVWANREIYAEMISDKVGIHVDPYLQRLIRRIKGDDRLILVSDSFVAHGPIPPGYDGADDINFDFSGEIAGTRIILDIACRSVMAHTGASVCQAFGFASRNPAALLSLDDRGTLAAGKKADIVLVDHLFNVRHVFKDGRQLK